MKIGIVSLYGWLKVWDNYGTLLQNYALQAHLARMGHTSYWIRTRTSDAGRHPRPNIAVRIRSGIRGALRPLLGPSISERIADFNAQHPRAFGDFMRRFVPCTEREYSIEELMEQPPEADALLVGSDQVWRDVTPLNFLAFGDQRLPRIAYAVSAPWPDLDDSWIARASREVPRFKAVSVRETEGIDVCRRIGIPDAEHVIDPTLLLERSDYMALAEADGVSKKVPADGLLAYFVNVRDLAQVPWNAMTHFSSTRGFPISVIPLQGAELTIPKEYHFVPTPTEWIRSFESAQMIVTNSYHGALFAVIMRKPFLVCLQGGETAAENCRFTSALSPLGLSNRLLPQSTWTRLSATDLGKRMATPIDWDSVKQQLAIVRDNSETFLSNALSMR